MDFRGQLSIVRMETDIVAPLTEIKLLAEHTAVEYGPVNFRTDNVELCGCRRAPKCTSRGVDDRCTGGTASIITCCLCR